MLKQSQRKQSKLKKLKNKSFSDWVKVFNEKHNQHLKTNVGIVNVKTKNNDK
jgi:predicted CopG family antitoxin